MALYYIKEGDTVVKERGDDVVVISPSLYWYAHATFPTKSISKAKKLADSYLASRPPSYTSIYVERREDGFDCYAYDEAHLRSLIEPHISLKTPAYFLQQFSKELPLRIDENLTADTINGIAVEMKESSATLPSLDSLDFGSVAKPFNKTAGEGFSKPMAVVLLILLFATAAGDLALRYQKLHALERLNTASDTGKSMYEIKALLKKYGTTDIQQRRLRATIQKALSSPMKSLECDIKKGCTYE